MTRRYGIDASALVRLITGTPREARSQGRL